jgi:hypothetical protein
MSSAQFDDILFHCAWMFGLSRISVESFRNAGTALISGKFPLLDTLASPIQDSMHNRTGTLHDTVTNVRLSWLPATFDLKANERFRHQQHFVDARQMIRVDRVGLTKNVPITTCSLLLGAVRLYLPFLTMQLQVDHLLLPIEIALLPKIYSAICHLPTRMALTVNTSWAMSRPESP